MRILMLFIFSVIPFELFAQKTKGDFADSITVCKVQQALGLPAMDKYAPGFKYIQELPSEGQYVLKPLKKIISLGRLTTEVVGFLTHKYTSEGSIISYNDDYTGLCFVSDLEKPTVIFCNLFDEDMYNLTVEELENRDLSKREISAITSFVRGSAFTNFKITGKQFIAKNWAFRDCDSRFCVKKQDVLLERGTCSVY